MALTILHDQRRKRVYLVMMVNLTMMFQNNEASKWWHSAQGICSTCGKDHKSTKNDINEKYSEHRCFLKFFLELEIQVSAAVFSRFSWSCNLVDLWGSLVGPFFASFLLLPAGFRFLGGCSLSRSLSTSLSTSKLIDIRTCQHLKI